ncbi:MAG: recombination regulator RecX [Kangiellaceae bacterium]|nr:recombination regulator RecX [Kangiellaceae bacterium]MCW8997583.1 recombination regulator RecX [Kangiellaceae bacterium]
MNDPQREINLKKLNKAISYAARLLGAREYSTHSIKRKLLDKGYSKLEVHEAISYLLNEGWLSDERFCESFIRSKSARGQGLDKILYELKTHKIAEDLAFKALEQLEINWQLICDEVALRKARSISESDEFKLKQKLERFLRYRGFSHEQIKRSVKHCDLSSGSMTW